MKSQGFYRSACATTRLCYVTVGLILLANSPAWGAGDGYAPWVGESFIGMPCAGSQVDSFGPYDYQVRGNMEVVRKHHFNSEVERLVAGMNAAGPANDLDYVLKVIPNHHRALNSAMNFHFRFERGAYEQQLSMSKTGYKLLSPVECYFLRALNFRPKDPTSRMLFGTLLHKEGRTQSAKREYEKGLQFAPNEPNLLYNYALLLVDIGDYEQAKKIADVLYEKGFPLEGLKKRLNKVGY